MLYVATERPGWLVVGALLFGAGAYFGYLAFGHVRVRFDAWLDPFGDPDRNGQIINGLFGLAHGGILGQGLGPGQSAADARSRSPTSSPRRWARSSASPGSWRSS